MAPTPHETDTTILYTVNETAEQLRIGRDSLYQLINTGELRSLKIGNRRLIPRKEIEEFVDQQLGESA